MHTSSASRRIVAWASLAVGILVHLPALSIAQGPVPSFDQLNTRLRVGEAVWVTDAQGREVKGRVSSVAPGALELEADGARVFRADEVRAVEHRRRDSLLNGALIGFGLGLAAAAAALPSACYDTCSGVGQGVAIGLGVAAAGAAIGIGVDAAIPGRRQTVYRAGAAASTARLRLMPVIGPRTKGLTVSFGF